MKIIKNPLFGSGPKNQVSSANSFGNTAQYFQNQNQQLMQQNQYRAPVNTNCQPNGVGGFNCTSR